MMLKKMDEDDKNLEWRFIPYYPTKTSYKGKSNNWVDDINVYWTQNEPPKTDTSSLQLPFVHAVRPEYWDVHEKIKYTLSDANLSPYRGILIQFWALVDTNKTPPTLSTSNQPFALDVRHDLYKYRSGCCTNKPDTTLPFTAYLNYFPEIIPDLRVYRGVPFFDKAIDFGFTCCILLPVFYPCFLTPRRTYCVGILQCCMKLNGLVQVFHQLTISLEKTGLKIFRVPNPYKNVIPVANIKQHTDEIQEALKIVCELYNLPLAQVWILNKKGMRNSYAPKPSAASDEYNVGTFVVRLCAYRIPNDDTSPYSSNITHYHNTCDVLPLSLGAGLVGKTLQSQQPHFCRNTYKFEEHGMLPLLCGSTHCSCFVISLRSTHTGDDVDYAFEFLWLKSRHYTTLLEPLLLTLNTSLPDFSFSSGSQLGDELTVLDVGDSTSFNLFHVSELPEAAAMEIQAGGKESPTPGKSKLGGLSGIDFYFEEYDDVIILAAYNENATRFFTRPDSTLESAKKIIEEKLNLDAGTYTLEYEFEGQKGKLNTDEDFASCIRLWTSSLIRRGQKSHIVVLVSTS